MPEYELDRDTRLNPIGEHRYAAEVSDAWGIIGVPNGGYLAALVLQALGQSLEHPDPFTASTHYLRRAASGPAEIEVDVLRVGRGHSTAVARLLQGGQEVLRTTATFGDFDRSKGPTVMGSEPPDIPPLSECDDVGGPPPGSTFAERVDLRFAPGTYRFLTGGPPTDMEIGGWLRLRDGRPPDVRSLALYADAFPPPVLNGIQERVWVPTLELTVHLRARPAPGWLRVWFRTRFLVDGYLEEDGELWDGEGRLVAISRQLARLQLVK